MTATTLTGPYSGLVDTFNRLAHTTLTRTSLPILAYAKLADGKIVSTNLDTYTVLGTGGFEVFGPDALLPTHALRDALRGIRGATTPRKAAGEVVTISYEPGEGQYGGVVKLLGFGRTLQVSDDARNDPEEYPSLPTLPDEGIIATVDAPALNQALAFAATARGKDDTLPMLTCIRVEGITPGTLSFAATDRYRLAVTECPGFVEAEFGFNLPGDTLPAIKAMTGLLSVHRTENTVVIRNGTDALVIRPLDSTFPAYQSLIPVETPTIWDVDRKDLLADVKAAGCVVDKGQPVRITFGESVTVQGSRPIDTDRRGSDEWLTGFNPKYLADGLAAFTSDTVSITAHTGRKPHMIRGERAGLQEGYECVYLIMVIKLPDAEAVAA